MMLNTTITGDGAGLPILLAHGLFGQGRNLGALARRLGQNRTIALVDMRNHGESFQDDDHSYAAMASDLAGVIDSLGGRADLIGHSMGGKAAMALALKQPDSLGKLVVLDVAPVAYGHSQTGYIDAMQSLDLSAIDRRSVADKMLADRIDDAGVRAFLLQSLDLKADPPVWKLNLQALRHAMDDIIGWPDDLGKQTFTAPALFLTGENSDYVTAMGEANIRRQFPLARIERIAGAGHWLHADAPDATADALDQFLNA